ncbi:MAG: hypothetical protein IPF68_13970 [Bacteroidales bacterium]|nr:hypothetical protein [Bacteroidales bacterium]
MKEFTGKRAGCLIQDNEGCVWLVASGLLQWTPGPGLRHYRKVGERSFGNIHAIFADTRAASGSETTRDYITTTAPLRERHRFKNPTSRRHWQFSHHQYLQ